MKYAVYFTAFPENAQKYITDLENFWEEEEEQQREMDEQLIQYISKLKKIELQEALLQLLFDDPEWQYDCFCFKHSKIDPFSPTDTSTSKEPLI